MRRWPALALMTALAPACTEPSLRLPPPPLASTTRPDAAVLTRILAERHNSVGSLRSMGRLTLSTPEGVRKTRVWVLVARPDRLRAEVLSLLGAAYVFTSRDGAMAAYIRRPATVYRGAASAANLDRYLNMPLPVTRVVNLLLGTPPLPPAEAGPSASTDGNRAELAWKSDGETEIIGFSGEGNPTRYEIRDAAGRLLLRADFLKYRKVGNLRFPSVVRLDSPPSRETIEIRWQEPELNPTLADSLFTLRTPEGSKEVVLDPVTN